MNKNILLFSIVGLSLLVSGCANVVDNIDSENVLDISKEEADLNLSEQEINGLIQMREEEKLARDVYTTLGEKWGNQIFFNIAQSEQTHTDAVKNLLDTYKISDPVIDDSIGSFTSPEIQQLFQNLVAQGNDSLLDALIVGAIIEDLDIYDLNTLLKETDKQNIQSVYNNLNNGSRNHLNAFVNNITNNGGVYVPKYISQSEYEEIISSQQGNNGNGKGR